MLLALQWSSGLWTANSCLSIALYIRSRDRQRDKNKVYYRIRPIVTATPLEGISYGLN